METRAEQNKSCTRKSNTVSPRKSKQASSKKKTDIIETSKNLSNDKQVISPNKRKQVSTKRTTSRNSNNDKKATINKGKITEDSNSVKAVQEQSQETKIQEKKSQNKPTLPEDWLIPAKKSYKPWAQESESGKCYIYCKYCGEDILVESCYGRYCHHTSKKHLQKELEWKNQHPSDASSQNHSGQVPMESPSGQQDKTKKIFIFEYNFIQFLAHKNCSLLFGDDLIQFLKGNLQDSVTLKESSIYRKKTSLILNEVFKPVIQEDIDEMLEKKMFSLIVDETVDISKKKHLALMVQFWDEGKGSICIPHSIVQCSNSQDSEGLFQLISKQIFQKSYATNLVAFASDGASVFRGKKNSVLKRLKDRIPQLWDLHCLSHCFNLIASFASGALPDSIELLVKSLYNHFAHSTITTANWIALQEEMNLKPYKILSWTKIRWSSLLEAVSRILERWNTLTVYFTQEKDEPDCEYILDIMEKAETKLYLQFLEIFLEKINILNKHFQKQVSQILSVEKIIKDFFATIMNIILKPEYKIMDLKAKLKLIQKNRQSKDLFIEETYIKNNEDLAGYLEEVYGGAIDFKGIEEKTKKTLVGHVQKFVIRLLYKAEKVLPYNDELFSSISCIFPSNFNEERLLNLAKKYTNIISPNEYFKLYEEAQIWEQNQDSLLELFKKAYNENIIAFYCDKSVRERYKYIVLLATTILIFPHSTVEVERLFSQLSLIKTEKRTKLSDDSLESLILVQYHQLDLSKPMTLERITKKHGIIKDKLAKLQKKPNIKRTYSQREDELKGDRLNQDLSQNRDESEDEVHSTLKQVKKNDGIDVKAEEDGQ